MATSANRALSSSHEGSLKIAQTLPLTERSLRIYFGNLTFLVVVQKKPGSGIVIKLSAHELNQ